MLYVCVIRTDLPILGISEAIPMFVFIHIREIPMHICVYFTNTPHLGRENESYNRK